MKNETLKKIYETENLNKYLRENSYWYKYINRTDDITKITEEMKEKYGLRFKDKVNKAKTSLDLINAFMSVTKE